ncbi:hypothetical protein F1880_008317 [Penicillium rolfsii]|nr:hypothetical protein F1880_008317 [Penicillium rolfsii]
MPALNAGIIVAAKANQNPPTKNTFLNGFNLTDGAENNTGKSIAEYELKNTSDEQQQATKEDNGSTISAV